MARHIAERGMGYPDVFYVLYAVKIVPGEGHKVGPSFFECGFGPLTGKVMPPLGSPLYWLRTGTVRLPPWPGRIPLTAGDRRTVADVVLYAALLAADPRPWQ